MLKEESDIVDLLDISTQPAKLYPTFEEPTGTEDAQAQAVREARNADAIRVWREEETRQSGKERQLYRGSTRGEADKRLKLKMFLSLRKQGQ